MVTEKLILENVSLRAGGSLLLKNISLTVTPKELVVILGSNGAGKSTLMRIASGLKRPCEGRILLSGVPIERYCGQERAQKLGYLPQIRNLAWPNRVEDVVALGRYAHGGGMGLMGEHEAEIIDTCLSACALNHLRHRAMTTLSGGEQTRVHCARMFAAQTPLLLADEPITALDPHHQYRIMDLLATYVKEGNGALVVLHDIALAARFANRLVWMKQGEIVADGCVAKTLTQARLAEVFQMKSQIDLKGAVANIHLTEPLEQVK